MTYLYTPKATTSGASQDLMAISGFGRNRFYSQTSKNDFEWSVNLAGTSHALKPPLFTGFCHITTSLCEAWYQTFFYNKPLRVLWHLLRYIVSGKCLFAMPFMQSSVFLRTSLLNEGSKLSINNRSDLNIRRPENFPDIEVIPSHHRENSTRVNPILDKFSLFNLMGILVQSKSRGSVRLCTSSPSDRPVVNLGFFTDPQPQYIVVVREGLRFVPKLAHQMTLEGVRDAFPFPYVLPFPYIHVPIGLAPPI